MAREIDEAWIDEAIERYRRIDVLRAEFEKAVTGHVVSVHSPDDTVEVLVTAAGDITDVRIRGSLQNRSAGDLAREVQAVVADAAEAARWARDKLHAEIFGTFRSLEER
ncbi:YbaB/EbfC family nucleoid-associated protein [Jidongwangia harbinensis]|uniref:YbaB/EbfC family nucleoid-associated protein n=1 Tax=Jidongwangia harbinensis TaxID=2878561 RepID=UPI001CD9AC1F|nr:YbaB/EbfC family nucleoid-associated protein [Jidongwangia harbinensis]MCA2214553.1 YbaB/EbfC family nucleoid-associated protein [Jidongwangia harbinensis]